MWILRDHEGRKVRLTRERLEHVLEHPEMEGLEPAIRSAVRFPQAVIGSSSDDEARLHYVGVQGTRVGDKLLCVVVKLRKDDAFVLTAYLTDKMKRGVQLWPRSE